MLAARDNPSLSHRTCSGGPVSSHVMRHKLNLHSLVAALLSGLLSLSCAIAQSDEVAKLSPAGVPVVNRALDLTVATVFPSEGTAKLLVFKGPELVSGSSTFDFPASANFGAAWVEEIEISTSSRFVVKVRIRQTCGPGSYDYTFVKRNGQWVLAQLQREELRCTDSGVSSDWKKTYNYLGGTLTSVKYQGPKSTKKLSRLKAVKLTLIEDFQALAAHYE